MTKRRQPQKVPEPSAMAFLNMANEYHRAATTLVSLGNDVESPIYFLYTHAIELALKAHLRFQGPVAPHIHDLGILIQKCEQCGLPVSIDLRNIVSLLETENSVHGFRYFAFITTNKPEIAFLREVVDALMAIVVDKVRQEPAENHMSQVVLKMTVGKPVNK